MRPILAAVLVFLLVTAWLSRSAKPEAPPASQVEAQEPSYWLLAALTLLVLAVSAARMYLDRYLIFDDAFMSYRYAKHLAFGHGLVWNVGERPVEGYTNFLLVVLLAPLIRLGADPLTATRVLSAIAALALGAVMFMRLRRSCSLRVSAAVTLAYLGSNLAFAQVMVGLETVLFTLPLFVGYHFAAEYLSERQPRQLWLAGAALFVGILLRPEAGLLAVLVSAVAAPRELRERRAVQHLRIIGLSFWLPFAIYLAWKLYYFGALLPNPAHVKVPSGGFILERGAETVFGFLLQHWRLLALALISIPLVRSRPQERLLAALLCGAYAAFYLHVDTLMDIYYRFLFPTAPFLFELAVPAFLAGIAFFDRVGSRLCREIALGLCFVFLVFPNTDDFKDVRRALHREFNFPPEPRLEPPESGHSRHMLERGRALATYPDVSKITMAAVDAGALPYVSDIRHIDLVGLNDRFIAHEHDLGRLLEYAFGSRPDIILHRDRADGSLITYGHGTLGDHRRWAEYAGWDDYRYAGTLIDVEPWRHEMHVFVRKTSSPALFSFIQRKFVDFVHPQAPVYGSARKAEREAAALALAAVPPADPGRFPLSISADRAYLVDAKGAPFLIRGDAGWSSSHELKREEFLQYLADRKARGFNAFMLSVIDHTKGPEAYPNAYGEKPLLVPGDFSTPNDKYYEQIDWLLGEAGKAGFLVFVTPAYLGYEGGDEGWYSNIQRNGAEKMRGYGRYVARRWQALDNIVWVEGGDFTPPPAGMALVDAVAAGIKDVDQRHYHTAHWGPETSGGDPNPPWLDIDTTYTYAPVYLKLARDRAANAGKRPFVLVESTYENEHGSHPNLIRTQAYHAYLSGSCGHFFGSLPVWNFGKGWQAGLDSPASRAMTQLYKLFESLPWWTLAPEPVGVTLVSGRGAFGSQDWASVARSHDGSLVVIYLPSARDVTIDLARLSRTLRARWFDPTSGALTAIEGDLSNDRLRTFIPPGTNQANDSDWVLLLDARR